MFSAESRTQGRLLRRLLQHFSPYVLLLVLGLYVLSPIIRSSTTKLSICGLSVFGVAGPCENSYCPPLNVDVAMGGVLARARKLSVDSQPRSSDLTLAGDVIEKAARQVRVRRYDGADNTRELVDAHGTKTKNIGYWVSKYCANITFLTENMAINLRIISRQNKEDSRKGWLQSIWPSADEVNTLHAAKKYAGWLEEQVRMLIQQNKSLLLEVKELDEDWREVEDHLALDRAKVGKSFQKAWKNPMWVTSWHEEQCLTLKILESVELLGVRDVKPVLTRMAMYLEMILNNVQIVDNLIEDSRRHVVDRLLSQDLWKQVEEMDKRASVVLNQWSEPSVRF